MMSMMSTRASLSGPSSSGDSAPLSPSPWDLLQRRRSSLGLSALFGGSSYSDGAMTNEHGHRLSWTLTAPDEKSMFAAIAELNSVAATTTATTSSAPATATASKGTLDGGADGASMMLVPDVDTHMAMMGAANEVSLSALLTGASDPMLKPSIGLVIKHSAGDAGGSFGGMSLSEQAAADAAARPLMVEIEPWALEAAAAASAAVATAAPAPTSARRRKRSRDEHDSDADGAFSDSGSRSSAASSPTPASARKKPATGAKRPRAPKPNSRAVLEAMPKPPPRGLKDPVREELYKSMDPEDARLEKNRQSAKECRLRKKEYVVNLEAKVAEFEGREVARAAELVSVRAQLAQLQREYQSALAASGRT